MAFLKIALVIVALWVPTTDLSKDMKGTLHLYPPCVQNGKAVYVNCCIATEDNNAASWYTTIKSKETSFKDSGLPNASFINRTGECELHSFIPTLDINRTVMYCLNDEVHSNNETVEVTTGYWPGILSDGVQVQNYTSEVHGNIVEFNFTLVPKDTVCPVEKPLNYSAVVSGHPSQTRLQIKNATVLQIGVTVPYDHIRSLANLTFNISFHYRQGRIQSIPPFEIMNPMYEKENSNGGGGIGNIIDEALGGGIGGALLLLALIVILIVVVVVIKKYCCKQESVNHAPGGGDTTRDVDASTMTTQSHEFDEGQPPAEEPKTTYPDWATEQHKNVCNGHTKETDDDNRCKRSDPKAAALRSQANGDEMKLINASEGGANGEPDEIAEEHNLMQATTEASSGGTSQFVASQI